MEQQNKKDIYEEIEVYDIKDTKTLKEKNIDTDKVGLQPTGKESDINKMLEEMIKTYGDDIPEDVLSELQYNNTAKLFASPEDVGCRDKNNLTNNLKHNDTEITIRKLKAKPKKTNSESIKLAMADAFGVGNLVHIPLIHSGFWITLKPLTNENKITLYLELAKEIDRLGKKTHDLIYTHNTAMFTRIIREYIRPKIIKSTLKLEKDEDIFDYIVIQDINLLMWGILKSLYPKGYNFTVECKNALVIDENTKKPSCTFKGIETKLDFSKMLWIDESLLEPKHLEIMSNRVDNSISKEEVLDYQETLQASSTQIITKRLTNDDGEPVNLDIYLKTPTINEFINKAEYIINKIEDEIINLVASGIIEDTEEEKAKAELELSKAIELQFFNHYIKAINFNGILADTPDAIDNALEVLSDTEEIKNEIRDKIIEYIDKSLVAIVGMPEFTCPVCKEKQTNGNIPGFIAFDVFMYFFTLLASRYQAIIKS